MSNSIPKREPAWAAAPASADCDFRHPVAQATRDWLNDVLLGSFFSNAVRIEGRLGPGDMRIGHFRAATQTGDWVVHVKPDTVEGDLELAADIADWLNRGQVPVVTYRRARDGAIERAVDGLHVTVTRFRPARHRIPSIEDAEAVGAGLARLHFRLLDCPVAGAVRRRSDELAEDLGKARMELVESGARAVPERWRSMVMSVARTYAPRTAFEGDAQCGHGDLSPGNVMFGENGRAIFCDFEDSAFCYRPRSFDLAMATLRFALEGGECGDDSTPQTRAAALLGSYAHNHGTSIAVDSIRRAIQGLSDHFILVLAALAQQQLVLEAAEWEKAAAWPELSAVLQ